MTTNVQWTFFMSAIVTIGLAATKDYYTAAVFEHATFRSENASAEDIVRKNLFFYTKATVAAKSKGADIIVFPEYGIFTYKDRQQMKKFLEDIPDPRRTKANPCNEIEAYVNRPILQSLSCMAKYNSIFVVANMGDIQSCEGEAECPSDGVFHYNANVVFDRSGTLVLKYHKEHLFFEEGMDLPRKQQDARFTTDFGTFATYICFDILFERMSNVSKSVDGIVFPTMWFFLGPQFTSVQTFQSWATGNNATILAANTHILEYYSVGSGIFHGQAGALAYTYNPDGISKVLIARVPKSDLVPAYSSIIAITENDEWSVKKDGRDVPHSCAQQFIDNNKKPHCLEEITTNYTFVKLKENRAHIEACNNGMCCSLDYTSPELLENYYLGVYNGTHNSSDRYFWCEENCVLVRCEAVGANPCATFPMKSETIFHHIELRAHFSNQHVFPSVVESGMRLVPQHEWKYEMPNGPMLESAINMKSMQGKNLIAAGFKGRCYQRDPPYVR